MYQTVPKSTKKYQKCNVFNVNMIKKKKIISSPQIKRGLHTAGEIQCRGCIRSGISTLRLSYDMSNLVVSRCTNQMQCVTEVAPPTPTLCSRTTYGQSVLLTRRGRVSATLTGGLRVLLLGRVLAFSSFSFCFLKVG